MTNQQLPFTKKFQMGLLVSMIRDYDFLRNIVDDLKPEYLDTGPGAIKLLRMIQTLHTALKKPLTVEIVRNYLYKMQTQGLLTEPQVAGMNESLDIGLSLTVSEVEYVKNEAFSFIRKQIIARAVGDSIEHLEHNRLDSVYTCVMDACKKTFNVGSNLGYNYVNEDVALRYKDAPRSGLWSSGFKKLDDFLGGGLAKKEAYTVLSPSGRGKTSLLCNFSMAAQKAGLNTLFITLEMPEKVIAQRHDSILVGFSNVDIFNSSETQNYLHMEIKKLNSGFYIKEFQRGGLSMNGLKTYIDRFCNEVFKPDCLILDWIACLQMPNLGKEGKRHEQLAQLADDFVNLTREYDLTGITAHQTNRAAVSNERFNVDDISESYASIFGFDCALGLGATKETLEAGKRILNIQKNRFGPDGVYVTLQGDLPGTSLTYRFNEVLTDDEADLMSIDGGV